MSLESPVGGSVHAGRSKCALDAQLVLAGLDIIRDLLQIVKALDVVQLVACLFQKADVGDDAIGLDDIGDAVDRIPVLELESIGGQVADNIGAGQVIAVILPVGQADRAVDLEHGRRIRLGHLTHQGGLILTGGRRDDCHRNTGLLCVDLGQILPGCICFRLEVQIIDMACAGICGRSRCRACAACGCCTPGAAR